MSSDLMKLKTFLTSVKTVFFDCDGVLWNSLGVIDGSVDVIKKLKQKGKNVFFITNNNTKSTEDCLEKFKKLNIDVKSNEMYCTAFLAAIYMKNVLKIDASKKVYVIGSEALGKEFDKAGIKHIGIGPLPLDNPSSTDVANQYNLIKDPEVAAVCVGFDGYFNLHKIAQAMQYLKDPNIPFIATNQDSTFPLGNGLFGPGTGCVVSAIATACGREPLFLGKPSTLFLDIAKTLLDIEPEKTMMIGDRLDTDIKFGINCGFQTTLVLTGVSTTKDMEKQDSVQPNYVLKSVKDMLEIL